MQLNFIIEKKQSTINNIKNLKKKYDFFTYLNKLKMIEIAFNFLKII